MPPDRHRCTRPAVLAAALFVAGSSLLPAALAATSRLPGGVQAPLEGPDDAAPTHRADFGHFHPSPEAREIADWVVDSGDSHGLPFIIVDKVHARVIAFEPDGRLRGASPALLGLARGDGSVPGIGTRRIADIRPAERTTPAGRFAAEMGHNAHGEDILWVDYDDAISMHRVRATNAAERRLQRLASATVADNRISYGCINLPATFYDRVVKPLFEPRNGIVYVLPETGPARAWFGAYRVASTKPARP